MIFPDAPRVLYDRNTLDMVVCQLRFPQILRIEAEEPVAFQERIRADYPILTARPQLDLASALPEEMAKLIGENFPLPIRQGRAYDFGSSDEKWKATLTGTFVALTATRSYLRWEDFKNRLSPLVEALVQIYQPAFFGRIGLRYQNVIRRSALGIEDAPWRTLIQPHVAGELAGSVSESAIETLSTVTQFQLDDGAKVVLRHGLGKVAASGETVYLLDADFFTENRTEVAHAIERLESFNREARRLLHWCITERLDAAMGPRPL